MLNQRYVEIEGQEVAVNEEVYRAFKQPLWAEHKRKEREKRCRDEKGRRCMKDCSKCPKSRERSILSLTNHTEVPNKSCLEDIVLGKLLLEQLALSLDELTPDERILIKNLYYLEISERKIAKELHITQRAVNKRKHKALEKLRKRLTQK